MKLTLNLKPILLLLPFLAFQSLKAQPNINKDQTFLWKVSGNGLNKDSYILLTTSNTCDDKLSLNKKTLDALKKVQDVSVESGLNDPTNESKLQKLVLVKNANESVKQILSNGLYNRLTSAAAMIGMNEVKLNTLKPIFICGLTINVINPCEIQNPKTMEKLIRSYAHDNNLKVNELVSPEENFDTFNAYPNSYWEKTLDFLINNQPQAVSDLEDKANFYAHENLRGVCAVSNKSELFNLKYSFKEIETKKIDLLCSRIENVIKNRSTIVLLDIANVANPTISIFTKLTKSGYVISPILN